MGDKQVWEYRCRINRGPCPPFQKIELDKVPRDQAVCEIAFLEICKVFGKTPGKYDVHVLARLHGLSTQTRLTVAVHNNGSMDASFRDYGV